MIQNVPAIATLNAADAIGTLAALGFLGYGIQPTEAAEWGYDLQRAIDDAGAGIWWTGLFPGLAIVLLITGFTLVGEGINDTLNPLSASDRSTRPRSPSRRRPSCRRRGPRERRRAPRRRLRGRCIVSEQGPVLDVRDLRVWYGTGGDPVRAVDGITFEIDRGETVGLVGESGCGKSTLGRGILGLLPKNASVAGEVLYQGRNLVGLDPDDLRDLRGPDLGLIFQEPMTRLDPLHTIESHFLETLRTHRHEMDKDEMRKRGARDAGEDGDPADPLQAVPARVLRRDAPADHDRAGAGARARAC